LNAHEIQEVESYLKFIFPIPRGRSKTCRNNLELNEKSADEMEIFENFEKEIGK
jgi:hypothetical protein